MRYLKLKLYLNFGQQKILDLIQGLLGSKVNGLLYYNTFFHDKSIKSDLTTDNFVFAQIYILAQTSVYMLFFHRPTQMSRWQRLENIGKEKGREVDKEQNGR